MTALLAVLSLALAGDVVHTRDGKKFEGKLVEYDFFVDVEADPPPAPELIARITNSPNTRPSGRNAGDPSVVEVIPLSGM